MIVLTSDLINVESVKGNGQIPLSTGVFYESLTVPTSKITIIGTYIIVEA